jgi:nucleoid-associated protein YgaU
VWATGPLGSWLQKLGLAGWQALYEANRDVIGGNPNLIKPGQVLVVP